MNKYYYDTVSEAVSQLQSRGYTIDFNSAIPLSIHPDDFEIVEVHRYEGESDPGDEAVVYALESKSGQKGILVSGFGMSAGPEVRKLLEKVHFHKN